MNAMITNYDHMPFEVYVRILNILDDKDLSELDQQVAIVAALSGCTTDEVLDLPVDDFAERTHALAFLEERPPRPEAQRPPSVIEAGGFRLRLVDPQDMNTAQFVDYQSLVKEGKRGYVPLLSVFLVPYGKTYGHSGDDDPRAYDIRAVRDAIGRHLTVPQVNNAAAFFLSEWQQRLRRSMTSLSRRLGRLARKFRDPSRRAEIEARLEALRRYGDGLTQ